MKPLLTLLLSLAALAAFAAPKIISLDYPKTLEAGATFRLQLKAEAAPGETLRWRFNGENRVLPPDLHLYPASAERKTRYATYAKDAGLLFGGYLTSGSNYHTVTDLPFPQDGKKYSVWIRYSEGPVCLRRPEKELKWLWGKPEKPAWVYAGEFDANTVGPTLGIMNAPKPPYAKIEAVLLTTADRKAFTPGEEQPGLFTWKTDASAAGRHDLELVVEAGGKTVKENVVFEVTAAKEAAATEVRIPAERQIALEPAKLNTDPKAYPILDFLGDDYRKLLAAMPFGLRFNDRYLLPLRCNAYEKLPDTVEFEVGKPVAGLAFLLSEYWQGEVNQEMAHFRIRYEDGSEVRIPLREEVEVCGSLRNRSPRGAFFAGVVNSPAMEFHLTILPWRNPHPEKAIKSIVFSNIRTIFSKEENKDIPLNVAGISSQLLLGLAGLTDRGDVEKLLAAALPAREDEAREAAVTIDFGQVEGKIDPRLFGTNETGVMTTPPAAFDEYLERMREINCRSLRFHSGWNLEKVYPNQLEKPNYEPLAETIRKLKATNPEWEIMICFNKIPSYVNPKTPEGRKLFAALAADLVRELNLKHKLYVRYWEIYNEVYFRKIDDDRALWHMYNETAAAIRKVDPTVKIGGYAPCWPVLANIRDFYRNCNQNTDFISYHKYLTGSVSTPTDQLMDQTPTFADDARRIREIAREITPNKPVELALTEYNINFNWKPHDPRQATHIGATWMASVLNHLIRNHVEIAQTWHSRGGGTFGLIDDQGNVRPAGKLLALCNRYLAGEFVQSRSSAKTVECLGFRNAKEAGYLLVNKRGVPVDVRVTLLNPPKFRVNHVLPAGESFAIREEGLEAGRADLPAALRLAPYETRIIVCPVNR